MSNMAGAERPPAISIVVVDSRSKEHPDWVHECLESVSNQYFTDYELIVIDNTSNSMSVGAAYNQALDLATSDWIYFLSDDDYVSNDFFGSLVPFLNEMRERDNDIVIGTTYSVFFDEEKEESALRANAPMGAYYKPFLVEAGMRFDEGLKNKVDVDMFSRLKEIGKKTVVMTWHFGYFYRQHNGQVSGRKVVGVG